MENTAYHALDAALRAAINKICELRHGHIKRFFWAAPSLPSDAEAEVGIKRLESHVPGACRCVGPADGNASVAASGGGWRANANTAHIRCYNISMDVIL